MPVQNRLEQRSAKLASALKHRVNVYSQAITPPGARPPFTKTFSEPKALQTILDHWNHPATQAWISAMDPQSQLELRNALGEHIKGLMPSTAQPDGMSVTGQAEMNRASTMAANPLAAGMFAAQRNIY